MTDAQPWHCEAYGPEGVEVGAVCFRSGNLHKRVCATAGECHTYMAMERERVFQRIRAGAASGDETMQFLAEQFTSPDQLLGGPLSDET